MAAHFKDDRSADLPPVIAAESIPLFAGRPRREKVIGREDLMDLDILLHTCDSIDALLAKI